MSGIPKSCEYKHIRTREEILMCIDALRARLHQERESSRKPAMYFSIAEQVLNSFTEKFNATYIFKNLEENWYYILRFDEYGLELRLNHNGVIHPHGCTELASFVICKQETKMLTAEEYARFYEVEATTVRSWIRRGKLFMAQKYGTNWYIPVLELPEGNNNRQSHHYRWDPELISFPEELAYLGKYKNALISKDSYHGNYSLELYITMPDHSDLPHEVRWLNTKEKEALESKLIENNQVKAVSYNGHSFYAVPDEESEKWWDTPTEKIFELIDNMSPEEGIEFHRKVIKNR